MQINEFKVFTWDRLLIYLGICWLLPVVAFTFGIHYNYFEHSNGIPLPGWIAGIGMILGFTLGDVMLFYDRWKFKKLITGYTTDGIAIFMPTYKIDSEPTFADICTEVEAATKYVVDFWEKIYPNQGVAMEDAMNGAYLGFTGQLIDLLAPPLFSNVIVPANFQRWAVGITEGTSVLCMWQEAESFTDKVIPRIKHELAHVALNAANISPGDGNAQHAIMHQYGFPF